MERSTSKEVNRILMMGSNNMETKRMKMIWARVKKTSKMAANRSLTLNTS
jgi:hypothetical protein